MIRLTLLFAALSIALPFVISYVANPKCVGIEVSQRFLERSNEMPAGRAEDDTPAKKLKRWVEDEKTSKHARAYALRVIPLDLIYLFILGGFLSLASILLVRATLVAIWFPASFVFVCCVLPSLYVFADVVEDLLIFTLMIAPDKITESSVGWLATFRGTKLVCVTASIMQVLILAGLAWKSVD